MLFHTWPFFVFFVIFYAVFLALRKTRFWLPWLLIASYVFYGWWNPYYLFLILYATTVDFFVVRAMDGSRHRRRWLAVSVMNNLGLMGFFKYGAFFTGNMNQLLAALGLAYQLPVPNLPLPVGISFFTFQSMSYTIDFYRGNVARQPSFVRFASFVALFPQLVAGPIERARQLLPQLNQFPKIQGRDVADGLSLFVVGLFKKAAMADYLSLYVTPIYATPDRYDAAALALATFAFAWQIYFDFSGYTDMARGIGRMMGIRFMQNFNNPYLATSLGNFWARWHISLSTWFRDYVYIPLGGNRRGAWRTYRNLFVTMVVSGLWHGAAWKFVIWGAIHAIATMLTRKAERSDWYRQRVPRFPKQVLVFLIVCLAWIFFRAENTSDAWLILSRITSATWHDPAFPVLALGLVSVIWIYQFAYESRLRRVLATSPVRLALVVAMIVYLMVAPGRHTEAFIYFQF